MRITDIVKKILAGSFLLFSVIYIIVFIGSGLLLLQLYGDTEAVDPDDFLLLYLFLVILAIFIASYSFFGIKLLTKGKFVRIQYLLLELKLIILGLFYFVSSFTISSNYASTFPRVSASTFPIIILSFFHLIFFVILLFPRFRKDLIIAMRE